MSYRVPEWLLKAIRERQSSVIEEILRGQGSSMPPVPLPPIQVGHSARIPVPPLPLKPVISAYSPDRYLIGVLNRYRIDKVRLETARQAAASLGPIIRRWAGKYYRADTLSGSIIKGTAVLGTTDVDLFISLAHDCPDDLQDIYESLLEHARLLALSPRPQNVSIRVRHRGVDIDLVPGKRQPGAVTDHSVYRRKTGRWTKTNVMRHIWHVRRSGRIHEIRATKIWRTIHALEFPTFPLELAVIEALHGRRAGTLVRNLYQVLEYLAHRFPTARLVDPANGGNVVSDDLTAAEKQAVAVHARASLALGNLRRVIW